MTDTAQTTTSERHAPPITLTRADSQFILSFTYNPELVDMVRNLPYAQFDRQTKTWTCEVSAVAMDLLGELYVNGLVDVDPSALSSTSDATTESAPAMLKRGTEKRPFHVALRGRGDGTFEKFRALPGGTWDKKAQVMSFPQTAAAALLEMVSTGVLGDPDGVLSVSGVGVTFDSKAGRFRCLGDPRADAAFYRYFPEMDVIEAWRAKGIDVDVTDPLTEELYRSELARAKGGFQPDGLKMSLYPYQASSVAAAVERSGFGVFDEMGLGKSAVAIAAGHELFHNRQEVTRTVIVVPGAVRSQMRDEIRKFSSGNIVVVDGTRKQRLAAYQRARFAPWLVVHYDVLATDFEHIAPLVKGSLLAGDEIHRIKSPNAKRTKAMRKLARLAKHRIAMSGTPILNEPGEWLSIVSGFIQPDCFGSVIQFLDRYCYKNRWGGYEGARNLGELSERSAIYYARHTKDEVAEHLPELQVSTKVLDTDPAYSKALKRAHREARDEIAGARITRAAKGALDGYAVDDAEQGADMTAVGMLKLMCCSPRLIHRSESPSAKALVEAGLVPDIDGPKLDTLREMAIELHAANRKVVVFTQSKRMANLIGERLTEDGVSHVMFTGDTSRKDRDAAVAAFTAEPTKGNPGPAVFVSTDAGGEGLNLQTANLLVNMDVPWTPGALSQRMARIHRVNSTHERFQAVNLTLAGTIEAGILKALENKQDLADSILGEVGGSDQVTGKRTPAALDELFAAALDDSGRNDEDTDAEDTGA